MLRIRNNMLSFYVKTPIFYKVYALTSGITYFYFPETLNTILINTGCIVTSELLDCVACYIKLHYPEKLLLNDIAVVSNVVAKIGSLGHVSSNLQILKALHSPILGFGYCVNSYLLQSLISGAKYSVVWGTVSSIVSWCVTKIFEKNLPMTIDLTINKINAELNSTVDALIIKANDKSDELHKLIVNINSLLENPKDFIKKSGMTFSL